VMLWSHYSSELLLISILHICCYFACTLLLCTCRLVQNYVVCGLEHKLDVLHSFLKSHLKSKTIVFLSSCAQVYTIILHLPHDLHLCKSIHIEACCACLQLLYKANNSMIVSLYNSLHVHIVFTCCARARKQALQHSSTDISCILYTALVLHCDAMLCLQYR
jgi:hypothetical protein